MRKLNKWLKLAPVGAFVFAIGACAEQSPTEVQLEPGTAAQSITAAKTLQVYPGKYTLDIGQVKQFVAIPRDSKGRTVSITSAKLTWSSTNPGVATVSSTGRVIARGGGTTYIVAKFDGLVKKAPLTVRGAVKAETISLSASKTNVKVGEYAQLTAVAKNASGAPVDADLSWKSSNTSAVRVYSNGLIKGVGKGSATVTVSGGGASAKISISVGSTTTEEKTSTSSGTNVATVLVFPMTETLKVGLGKQFIALPRDKSGSTLSGKSVSWKSSNTSVATVSSTGLVITRSPGTAVITATVDGVVGKGSLSVVK